MTSLTIPNSVTTIGKQAFRNCSGLTSVTIPNSLTTIGDGAFVGCSGLTSLTIPNSVTTIGEDAFNNCRSLTSLTIPNSVTTIGDGAFWECTGLTSLTIPNSVTTIGYSAFFGCSGLTSVTIPNSLTTIGANAFTWCTGLTSLTIPNSVTTIGGSAFVGCTGLTSLTIPNSVTTIEKDAFSGCTGLQEFIVDSENPCYFAQEGVLYAKSELGLSLQEVVLPVVGNLNIPEGVVAIGGRAFYECSGLTSVTIPYSVTTIGEYAFFGCESLEYIKIPASVESLGLYCFENCSNLREINIDCNTDIFSDFDNIFINCPIETIYVRDGFQWGLDRDNIVVLNLRNRISLYKEGYATMYYDYPFILPEGCQAGIVTGSDDGALLVNYVYQAGDIVPERTAVLIKGKSSDNGSYVSMEYPTDYRSMKYVTSDNFLKGVLSATSVSGSDALAHYTLSYGKGGVSKGENIGFYYANDYGFGISSVGDNECYLELPYVNGMPEYFLLSESMLVTEGSFTIPAKEGYGTYFTDHAFVMPEGVEGGVVTDVEGERLMVDYRYTAGCIVPANTALLLKGAQGAYNYTGLLSETTEPATDNLLCGSTEDIQMDADETCYFYKLSYNQSGTDIGFYWGAEGGAAFVNPANKAYLKLSKPIAASAKYFLLDGSNISGIDSMDNGQWTMDNDAPIYDLSGRRVLAPAKGGIYVKGGKKYIVK